MDKTMDKPADDTANLTFSLDSCYLVRVMFECVPVEADITALYCANPYCPCKNVTLDFFEANDKFDTRLFRLYVNYEEWRIESSEIFMQGLGYEALVDEFMGSIDERIKAEILSRAGQKAEKEHALRDDIELSRYSANSMVLYSEIYSTKPFEDLYLELEGKEYFVLDQYCPNPKCNCKDVVLLLYVVDVDTIKGEPILTYKIKFETGKGTVVDKSIGISSRFVKDLHASLSNAFGGSDFSFFENRYRKIKEWGSSHLGAKGAKAIKTTQKAGRNDPCPCGSGKKYKKCCGLST